MRRTMGAVAGQRPWTADEEAILRAEWPRGAALSDLAGRLDRSQGAIVNRLTKLGITRDSAPAPAPVAVGWGEETAMADPDPAPVDEAPPSAVNDAYGLPTVQESPTVPDGMAVLVTGAGEVAAIVGLAPELPAENMTESIPATEVDPVADLLAAATSVAALVGKLREQAATATATAPLQAIIDRQAGLLAAYQEALAGRAPIVTTAGSLAADLEEVREDLRVAQRVAREAVRERDDARAKLTNSISERADLELSLKEAERDRDLEREAVAVLQAGLTAAQQEIADLKKVGRLVAGDGVLRSQVAAQRTLIRQLCIMLAVRQDLVPRVEAAKDLNMTVEAFRAALERAAQGGQVAVETGGEVKL